MLHAAWHDIDIAGPEPDIAAIPEFQPEGAAMHHEQLVLVGMGMPDKLVLSDKPQ